MNDVTQKFRKMTDIEHVRARPATYAGSKVPHTKKTWLINDGKVEEREITYIPLFLKMFDEVISNCVDHSKRKEGSHLDTIDVTINQIFGTIAVRDNGGIPVLRHPEYDNTWIPDMIFGELRTGSNYDDSEERTGTGMNGLGAKLTNVFSSSFAVETSDGKNKFARLYTEGNTVRSEVVVQSTNSRTRGTTITYTPDWEYLGLDGMDDDSYDVLVRRVHEVAACNPNIKVTLNGNPIEFNSFRDFIGMFDSDNVYMETDRWRVGLALSTDGFRHTSFVNSTATYVGGTHVEYVADKIVDQIRDHVEKKTKQKIKPSDIKSHFNLFIDCTIVNPTYDSQTKENLVTEVRSYGSSYEPCPKFIKQVIGSKVVAEIIEWAERKQKLQEMAEIKKLNAENAKSSLRHIVKYEPATSKVRGECVLFLCEGDSAANPLISARDPKIHGVFPLRGKPLNVRNVTMKAIMANAEFANIIAILGLKVGEKADVSQLRYNKLVVATDADPDGWHIFGLLINMFQQLWPDLLREGFIQKLKTPLLKVKCGRKTLAFFSMEEFEDWDPGTQKFEVTYLKGLGGNTTEDFKKYMFDKTYFETIRAVDSADFESIDLAFDPNKADQRKEWLYGA